MTDTCDYGICVCILNPLGAAGVAGALVYAGLAFLIHPDQSLLIQLYMPVVMLITYLFILGKPGKILPQSGQTGKTSPSTQGPYPPTNNHSDGGLSVDDSKPLLEEADDEDDGDVAQVRVGSKWKLKLFNKEEAGMPIILYGIED